METSGSDHWTTDVYMLPQPGSHLNSVSAPAFQGTDTMGVEVAQPDYIVDQNLYYTPAVAPANYYGYIYTGFESPGEWDDHYRVFGVDGQDLHYQGLQTEGLQYAYYTPSGYAQSPYSPYNTYVPGAVIGADSSVIGAQQYASSSAYQHPVISPGYLPVVFQPGADIIPSISPGPSLANSGESATNRPENQVVQYTLPSSSVGSATSGQKEAVHAATGYNPLVPKSEEASHAFKKNMVPGNMPSSSVLQNSQGRSLPMPVQAADKFIQGNEIPQHAPLKVNVPSHGNFTELGSNAYGWVTVDAPQPRMQFPGFLKSGGGTPDMLGEKNRGPRASRTKAQWSSVLVGKAFTNKAGVVDAEGNIIINTDRYNRSDFPVNYPSAKFFVIKSYSEDDVHKSIKYNVWSSTPNGNRRLDAAYEEAKRISGGNLSNCPIFLFFSVNASGQFCGVAEVAGPVDFHKDMDFWQQDKWTGSFPVKWHIVKDVPNTSFRHIILENNENKPVTNSRDTQEILFIPGMNMLTIFKDSLLRTSILDDFMYYEERQKIMYEEKLRLIGRSYEQPAIFANPPSFSPARQYVTIKEPHQRSERRPVSQSIIETKNKAPDNKVPSGVKNKTLDNQVPSGAKNNASDNQVPSGSKNKTPDTQAASESNKAHASNAITEKEAQVVPNSKSEVESSVSNVKKADDSGMSSSNAEREGKRESTECDRDVGSIVKISSLSIDEKEDGNINESNESTATPAVTSTVELPTNVGSEPVKANGFVADTFTVGTIPIDTKSMENKPSPTG